MLASNSLEAHRGDELVFSSGGKWLYPLFELEDFLRGKGIPAHEIAVEDKVTGRAAAFLILRLGAGRLHSHILSRRGREILEKSGINYSFDTLVDTINCITEDILADEIDIERVYALLKARATGARA